MSSKRLSSTPPQSLISAAIVVGNDDLLIQIFLFLHAKFLVRFKWVSKRWCSLISAPSFCCYHTINHLRRPPEIQPLFIHGHPSSDQFLVFNATVPRYFPFSFPFLFTKVQILQSCNGILLLRCGNGGEGNSHSYHVFNPATMQQRDLSPLPSSSTVAGLYLMFDPSLSPHYKLVLFVFANKCTIIYVYDSEMHKWKCGGERNKNGKCFQNGIYFNGGIYFVRFGRSSYRFDPDNHLSDIPIPPRRHSLVRHTENNNYAMESNGVLFSFTLSWKEEINRLYVLEMNENENRWIKKYEADMNLILATCGGGDCRAMSLLGMIRGEKEQDSLLLFRLRGNIKIYKFYDGVVKDLYGEELRNWSLGDVHHFFIQSLALV